MLAVSAKLAQPGVGDGLVKLERTESTVLNTPEALQRIAADADWRATDEQARSSDVSTAPVLAAGLAGIKLPATPERVRPVVTPPAAKPAAARSAAKRVAPAATAPKKAPKTTARKTAAKKRKES